MGNMGRIMSLAPQTIIGVGALTVLGIAGAFGAFFAMDYLGIGADISGLALAGCCGTSSVPI